MKKVLVIAAAALAMAVGSFAFATAPPETGITKSNVTLYLPDVTLPGALIALPAGVEASISAQPAIAGLARTCASPSGWGNVNFVDRADALDRSSAMPGGASLGVANSPVNSFYT